MYVGVYACGWGGVGVGGGGHQGIRPNEYRDGLARRCTARARPGQHAYAFSYNASETGQGCTHKDSRGGGAC